MKDTSNAADFSELNGILIQLTRFDTIASRVIWYNVLRQVNFVSKHMQSISVDVDVVISLMQASLSWIQNFQEHGFEELLKTAKSIAAEANQELKEDAVYICAVFTESRATARQLSSKDVSFKQKYKVEVFLTMVDKFTASLSSRFSQ